MLITPQRASTSMPAKALATLGALLLVCVLFAGCTEDYQAAVVAPPLVVKRPSYHGPWADVQKAKIRPGAQINTPSGACTANFLFHTPDNKTLFMGLAAHCFGEEPGKRAPIGAPVTIGGVQNAGSLYYDGWAKTIDDNEDFALVVLSNSPAVRGQVNPAVLYFGGPTGFAKESDMMTGSHVITYGHSPLRPSQDPENPREGYILQKDGDRISIVTNHPGIPGDSGSGVMLADGRAAAVITQKLGSNTNGLVDQRTEPTINYAVDLEHVLGTAHAAGGNLADVEVVTWPILTPGQFPG